jgi:threonine/homoserine/homoserine lactone efflux protein
MDVTHSFMAFTVAAGLLTMTPGLDTAIVLRTAAVEGWQRGMQVAVGIVLGCLVWAGVAAIGLGALLQASRIAYEILRVAGALYILWLGAGMLLASLRSRPDAEAPATEVHPVSRSWALRGFLTNLLNPKVGVFYISFLPMFIPPHVNVVAFSMLLASIHAAEGLAWFLLLTAIIHPLAGWIQQNRVKRALDGVTGGVLVAFGLGLLVEKA